MKSQYDEHPRNMNQLGIMESTNCQIGFSVDEILKFQT